MCGPVQSIIKYDPKIFLCTPHQFGFLPGRSALQQLIIYINSLLEAKQHNKQMDVVYMDFRKAFDSVSHHKLLIKMRCIGIQGNLLLWFQSYLSSRRQCVRVGDSHSEFCDVLSGVPQGSILGPLLFAIYINDLPDSLQHVTPYIFADDTKCTIPISTNIDSTLLQSDLSNLSNWSTTWKLLFNEARIVHVCFWQRTSQDTFTYYINTNTIDSKSQHKDLGVILTSDLYWTPHYKLIIGQAYKIL